MLALWASLVFYVSCSRPDASFGSLLAEIDSSPQAVTTEKFIKAASLANGTEDQLRLLKRASKRSSDSYAAIAAAIAKDRNVSEPVALAMLDAYLSASQFAEALTLFHTALDASTRAAEYAEALVFAYKNRLTPVSTIEQLVACADATGDDRFLVYAATQALIEGDRATAKTLLVDALRFNGGMQSSASYLLLWDAGAVETLASRMPAPTDPLEIAICADAEYLIGDITAASASWAYLIDRFPTWSWKPYAALARAAATEPEPAIRAWPHAPPPDSWTAISAPSAIEAGLRSLIEELFPGSSEASMDRARWLRSKNQIEEARDIVSSLSGESAAIARLEYGNPERAVPEALRLAAEYPSSPVAYDVALETLANAGAWDRFTELAEVCRKNGLQTRRSWFWDSIVLVLGDNTTSAASIIRKYGPGQSGYAGALNLGMLELAGNRAQQAAEAFMLAVGLAQNQHEKAVAYVKAGDALQVSKLPEKAIAAYEAAVGADPASREARSRLMRLRMYN